MSETSADLRKRAELVRFNRWCQDHRPTAWFASLKPREQDKWRRALDRRAAQLEREARAAAKRELAEAKRNAAALRRNRAA